MDQLKKEFSVSPQYFDFTELFENKKLARNRKICQFLETRPPRYTFISGLKNHLKIRFFATIFFHHDKLKAMLHKKCPLHASPIFRYIPSYIISFAQISHTCNIMEYNPEFTGIPPHILLMSEINGLKHDMEYLKKKIIDQLQDVTNKRGFYSLDHNTKTIIDAMES